MSIQEKIDKLREYSVKPELILDGCGHGCSYYGVQSKGRPPVDPELIKEVEEFLTALIPSLVKFCNFTSDGRLRCTCNYNHGTQNVYFEGVGYYKVEEMVQWILEEEEVSSAA